MQGMPVVPTPPPFLNLNERIEYLYRQEYFEKASISDDDAARIDQLNFHYFLGYARNYRMLVGRGLVGASTKKISDVFAIIDQDHTVSEILYRGIRQAEWALRQAVVKHYCACFDSAGSFLDEAQYLETEVGSSARRVSSVLDQTLRYREPYVSQHVDETAKVLGLHRFKRYDPSGHADCVRLVRDLPLWSIVDAFSLGTLSHFITECDSRQDDSPKIWKSVAQEFSVSAAIFQSQLEALVVLRNIVFHQSRLWMRPTTQTPKTPKMFQKQLRGVDPKAMHVGFLNLALFQPDGQQRPFAEAIEAAISENPDYRYGVTKVRHHI